MKLMVIVVLFLTLCAMWVCVPAAEDSMIDVTPLTDQLYKLTIDAGTYTVNMLALVGDDGVLLVDTGMEESAEEMKALIEKFGKGTPKFIVNTHAHVDHTGANGVFGDEPVIIAHNVVRNRLRSGRYVIDEFPDEALPDLSFEHSLTLYFNGDEIRVIAIPGSHDDSDAIVYFTKAGVAALGDLAYGMHFPSVDGMTGNTLKYGEAVQTAIEMLPDTVTIISGHGRDCTLEDMKEFHDMLVQSIDVVREGLAEGKDVETLQKEDVLGKWASYGEGYNSADYWIRQIANDVQDVRPKKSVFEPLYYTLKEKGVDAVIEQYRALKKNHGDEYVFSDTRLYFLAYRLLLEKGRYEEAIKVFKANIKEYPESANIWATYDAMAEAYAKLGNKKQAIKNYKISLELYPDNAQTAQALKQLEEN